MRVTIDMDSIRKKVLVIALLCAVLVPGRAQVPPGTLPPKDKPEKPEPLIGIEKKIDDARRAADAAKSSNAKKSSSSSKSRSAEIRAMAFADDSLRVNRPLIIRNGKMDAKAGEQLREDLLVMCRIIEKAAREQLADLHKAAGIDLLALGGGNRSVRTMYLDEYGVVFTLNVRIPLRDEAVPDEPEVKEAALNEEWEETKNELFGQKRRAKRPVIAHAPPYDEQDVQELKNELLDALRNAANIRNLKPTDWIIIAVTGPSRIEGEVLHVERLRVSDSEKGERQERNDRAGATTTPKLDFYALDDSQSNSDSTMILRVRKSDLDAVVKKDLSPEEAIKEVGKAVNVQTY